MKRTKNINKSKISAVLVALAMITSLTACQSAPEDNEQLTTGTEQPVAETTTAATTPEPEPEPAGTTDNAQPRDTAAILQSVIDAATEILGPENGMAMTFNDPITPELSMGMLGLSTEDFGQYVTEATASNAAIMSIAHEVALVKCTDSEAAYKVRDLIASGFNSGKWICVMPQQSFVISSGEYVLLGATKTENAEAIQQAFANMFDNSETVIFYNGVEDGIAPGGGLILG